MKLKQMSTEGLTKGNIKKVEVNEDGSIKFRPLQKPPPPMPKCKPPRSETINRIEVIGPEGRMYVKYLDKECKVEVNYQDGGKTLKLFLMEDE